MSNNRTNEGNTVFHLAEKYLSDHYEIYENVINNKFYIKPKNSKDEYKLINENDIYIEIQKSGLKLSFDNLFAILKSSFTEKINPIEKYFNSLQPWDKKTDHIREFTNYIKAIDKEFFYTQLTKWLVRAIRCVFIDREFNKQALIFAQQGQNSGKTTLCRFFCPKELNDYKKEHLDNLKSKDTKIELVRNFLIDLDELAIMHKTDDMKSLKALMTTDFINERLPYGRSNVTLPRRCSFIGSTDNFDFLKDKTDNVRWLVIELETCEKPIDFDYSKKIKIDDVWCQAYYLYKDKSFKFDMTADELRKNEENNEKYFITDSLTEAIKCELKPGRKNVDEFMTATDILKYLREIDTKYYDFLKNEKAERIGRSMRQLGFAKDSHTIKKDKILITVYGYYVVKLTKNEF